MQKQMGPIFVLSNFFFLLYTISLRVKWDCCHNNCKVVERNKIIDENVSCGAWHIVDP